MRTAAAIVYQQEDQEIAKITPAGNSLISELGGMLCDGAKSARALNDEFCDRFRIYGLKGSWHQRHGRLYRQPCGKTLENLSSTSKPGMSLVEDTMLQIMIDPVPRREGPSKSSSGQS